LSNITATAPQVKDGSIGSPRILRDTGGGVSYSCFLTKRFRRHNPEELADISAGMKRFGWMPHHPALLYRDTTENVENAVLDGEGRLETAIALEIPPVVLHLGDLTTEEAYSRAKVINDARRHDDEEAIAARRLRVAQAKAAGMSNRTIAEKEKVSHTTVQRDLETATGTYDVPVVVKGRDGKQRPSKQPQRKTATAAAAPIPDDATPDVAEEKLEAALELATQLNAAVRAAKPYISTANYFTWKGRLNRAGNALQELISGMERQSQAVDAAGNQIPNGLRDLFCDPWLSEAVKDVERLVAKLRSATRQLHWLKPETFKAGAHFARLISDAIPHVICDKCGGKGTGCGDCKTSGYLPKYEHENREHKKAQEGAKR